MPDTDPQRAPEDDSAARTWARETRDSLEGGKLSDQSVAIAERLDTERRLKTSAGRTGSS
jgi:hypothetical protein